VLFGLAIDYLLAFSQALREILMPGIFQDWHGLTLGWSEWAGF